MQVVEKAKGIGGKEGVEYIIYQCKYACAKKPFIAEGLNSCYYITHC
jgi:hypothetical protein